MISLVMSPAFRNTTGCAIVRGTLARRILPPTRIRPSSPTYGSRRYKQLLFFSIRVLFMHPTLVPLVSLANDVRIWSSSGKASACTAAIITRSAFSRSATVNTGDRSGLLVPLRGSVVEVFPVLALRMSMYRRHNATARLARYQSEKYSILLRRLGKLGPPDDV